MMDLMHRCIKYSYNCITEVGPYSTKIPTYVVLASFRKHSVSNKSLVL